MTDTTSVVIYVWIREILKEENLETPVFSSSGVWWAPYITIIGRFLETLTCMAEGMEKNAYTCW